MNIRFVIDKECFVLVASIICIYKVDCKCKVLVSLIFLMD